MGLQVFNISLNQSDFLLGKMGNGIVYVNEMETVVEFIVEFCITGNDVFPETQVPGGTLIFEEEETHHSETGISLFTLYNPDHLYINHFSHQMWSEPSSDVTTPPPRA